MSPEENPAPAQDLHQILTALHTDVREIKQVLQGDKYGNEGVVSRLNKVEKKVLYYGALGTGVLAAVEIYHNFLAK